MFYFDVNAFERYIDEDDDDEAKRSKKKTLFGNFLWRN